MHEKGAGIKAQPKISFMNNFDIKCSSQILNCLKEDIDETDR